MKEADWGCWKKLENQFEQVNRPFLSELNDDNQDHAH
jgi:hypothetical protein